MYSKEYLTIETMVFGEKMNREENGKGCFS